jgi:hypothetical protein
MDNVHKYNICNYLPSSQTFRSYLDKIIFLCLFLIFEFLCSGREDKGFCRKNSLSQKLQWTETVYLVEESYSSLSLCLVISVNTTCSTPLNVNLAIVRDGCVSRYIAFFIARRSSDTSNPIYNIKLVYQFLDINRQSNWVI